VIWCHNGNGMEAPVATALGKLDAFNLFDPYWMDPEYDLWYAMLNCGFKLPASTGSDWFICSANRVYAYTGRDFTYADWTAALQGGRTFITNGAALFLRVSEQGPGDTVVCEPGSALTLTASWQSHYSVERVEILWNGKVIASRALAGVDTKSGELTVSYHVPSDGWLAARLSSHVRDSYFQPIFAHTSPVYVTAGRRSVELPEAAAYFDHAINEALEWVNHKAKFRNDTQRSEVVALFREGQEVYRKMV
jgi:hypothetical protein